ncbi:MAG TPA: nicotinate-nucleotide--dimethylbenzimidazole phosphoribosyltransferase [Candidatus Choladousia intestinigallinarum]|nr:nicotinate-nucleotide--dimethylbenzimidazole phosphoribosyltransferase [Candidatus Choladousia intestinigallinarum]
MKQITLEEALEGIMPADQEAQEIARKRWDSIAKPLYSLGWMEDAVARIAGAQHTSQIRTEKKILVPLCADNGIVEEGVTQTGQDVTAIVAENFLDEKSCAAIICRQSGADIFPVDIGMAVDTPRVEKRKVAYGTKNFAKEKAMTREQALQALETGINLVGELKEKGYSLIATGEMGIGNTTTSSAVGASLLKLPAQQMTGRGAGLSNEGLRKKVQVIGDAIKRWNLTEQEPLEILSCVGGFDLGGMAGMFLGGAYYHVPILIDGFISSVAALLAVRMCPEAKGYMLASHVSKEFASRKVLEELGLPWMIDGGLCLGEGSGAAAVFHLIEMGNVIYQKMSTFEQIHVEAYQPLS